MEGCFYTNISPIGLRRFSFINEPAQCAAYTCTVYKALLELEGLYNSIYIRSSAVSYVYLAIIFLLWVTFPPITHIVGHGIFLSDGTKYYLLVSQESSIKAMTMNESY